MSPRRSAEDEPTPTLCVCVTQGKRVALMSPSGDYVPGLLNDAGVPYLPFSRHPFTVVRPEHVDAARAAAEAAGWRVIDSIARKRQEWARAREADYADALRGDAAATEGARRHARAATHSEPAQGEN